MGFISLASFAVACADGVLFALVFLFLPASSGVGKTSRCSASLDSRPLAL